MNTTAINEEFYVTLIGKGNDFIARLPRPISFDEFWKVALCEIIYVNPFTEGDKDAIFVESTMTTPSFLNTQNRQILLTVPTILRKRQKKVYSPKNLRYVKVIPGDYPDIHIYIRESDGTLCSLYDKTSTLTLHFVRTY